MQKRLFSFEPRVWEGEATCPNPQNESLLGQGTRQGTLMGLCPELLTGSFWCEMFIVVNTVLLGGARCGVLGVQRVSVAPYAPVEAD